jgi:hypothetical protein
MIVQVDDTNTRSVCEQRNRIQMVPGKGWFTILRLYGALEPWFDKTWKAGEFEVVKWFDHKALRRNYEGKNRFDRFSAGVHV